MLYQKLVALLPSCRTVHEDGTVAAVVCQARIARLGGQLAAKHRALGTKIDLPAIAIVAGAPCVEGAVIDVAGVKAVAKHVCAILTGDAVGAQRGLALPRIQCGLAMKTLILAGYFVNRGAAFAGVGLIPKAGLRRRVERAAAEEQ